MDLVTDKLPASSSHSLQPQQQTQHIPLKQWHLPTFVTKWWQSQNIPDTHMAMKTKIL
jgi:hypothetical protein